MPDPALFEVQGTAPLAEAFRREFVRQVTFLSIPDINRYSMKLDRAYSVRNIEDVVPAFNYQLPFRRGQRTGAGREFRAAIVRELARAGSPLTPEDIIHRAETQNCVGCHGKPGAVGGHLVFPDAFEQGEHISADSLPARARLSPALQDVFLPYRIGVLRNYLQSVQGIAGNPGRVPNRRSL